MLIIKYDRIDFFGNRIYTEDKKNNYSKDDIRKVFQCFNKDYHVTFEVENMVMFWDSLSEFENKIVSVRSYENNGISYDEKKIELDKLKKEIYKEYR